MPYPPEPWNLRGQMHMSVWLVRLADLPAILPDLSPAVEIVTLGRRAFVGVAWVAYEPGGDMEYREILAAVLMRSGLRPRVTITGIWVNSVDSRDGGRELWGIPKKLATFDVVDGRARAQAPTGVIAEATLRTRLRLPGRWPIGFRVTQLLHSEAKTTPVRASARLGVAGDRWRIPAGGPLGFLAGRMPLLSITAADFRMRFGEEPNPHAASRLPTGRIADEAADRTTV